MIQEFEYERTHVLMFSITLFFKNYANHLKWVVSNWLLKKKKRYQIILKDCYNILLFKPKTTFTCSITSIIMTLFQFHFFITYGHLLGYIVGNYHNLLVEKKQQQNKLINNIFAIFLFANL